MAGEKGVPKDPRLELELFEPGLDEVADADDAGDLVAFEHREMTVPPVTRFHASRR